MHPAARRTLVTTSVHGRILPVAEWGVDNVINPRARYMGPDENRLTHSGVGDGTTVINNCRAQRPSGRRMQVDRADYSTVLVFARRARLAKAIAACGVALLPLIAGQAWAQASEPRPSSEAGDSSAVGDSQDARGPATGAAVNPANEAPGGGPNPTVTATKAAGDEVIVTGFRGAILDSTRIKRGLSSIGEIISAEDIGKLPDVSIAESIARLPGIAGQRVNGRVQNISIRGLSEDFTTTLLNGRQQVSSSDNRAVEYDQYPSELINGVTVYKTPNAGLTGQGLAGTVDLRTVRPLQFTGNVLNFNVRGETNTLGQVNPDSPLHGYRVSASYIGKFFGDTLGIAFGYSRLDAPLQIREQEAWFWTDQGGRFDRPNSYGDGGQEFYSIGRDQVRDGFLGVVEWQPTSNFHSVVDVFYSTFSQTETKRGAQFWSFVYTNPAIGIVDPTLTDVGNGISANLNGTYQNVRTVIRNDLNKRQDDQFAIGWNTSYTHADTTAILDLGYSRAKRNEQILETYQGYNNPAAPRLSNGQRQPAFDTVGYAYSLNGRTRYRPTLDYSNPSNLWLGDPAAGFDAEGIGGYGQDARAFFPRVTDELFTADFRIDQSLKNTFVKNIFSGFEIGAYFNQRKKDKTVSDVKYYLYDPASPVTATNRLRYNPSIDPRYINRTNTSIDFVGFGSIPAVDLTGDFLQNYYTAVEQFDTGVYNRDWTIRETLVTPFFLAKIEAPITSDITIRGNIGVQYELVDQRSTGFLLNSVGPSRVPVQQSVGTTYDNILPSINLIAELPRGLLVRFGASKQTARPRLDDLRSNSDSSVNPLTRRWQGSGGNPFLRPWRATALDLSVEKYFARGSYIAIAGFYKDLDSYIYTRETDNFDFTGFTNLSNTTPISNIGIYSGPANGDGAKIRGFEISGTIDFGLFTEKLAGFGIIGSYSNTNTTVPTTNQFQLSGLPGFSPEVRNLTAYFERDLPIGSVSARISQRWRSSFNGEILYLYSDRGFRRIRTDQQIDFQVSYSPPKTSVLAGATLLFQINNLTNSPYRTQSGPYGATVENGRYAGGVYIPDDYDVYGQQILAGFTYKFGSGRAKSGQKIER